MQGVRNTLKDRLNFQRLAFSNEPSENGIHESQFFKTKKILRAGTHIDIDFKNNLFFEILPLLCCVISECRNHSYSSLVYADTTFKIFLILDIGRRTALMTGYVENGQSLSEIDPDYGSEDKYGTRLDKPYGLRLHEHNWYERLSSEYNHLDPHIPPHVPFKQDVCLICVTRYPNILCSGCGHMYICDFCDRTYPVNPCPLCRRECANKFYLNHYQKIYYRYETYNIFTI